MRRSFQFDPKVTVRPIRPSSPNMLKGYRSRSKLRHVPAPRAFGTFAVYTPEDYLSAWKQNADTIQLCPIVGSLAEKLRLPQCVQKFVFAFTQGIGARIFMYLAITIWPLAVLFQLDSLLIALFSSVVAPLFMGMWLTTEMALAKTIVSSCFRFWHVSLLAVMYVVCSNYCWIGKTWIVVLQSTGFIAVQVTWSLIDSIPMDMHTRIVLGVWLLAWYFTVGYLFFFEVDPFFRDYEWRMFNQTISLRSFGLSSLGNCWLFIAQDVCQTIRHPGQSVHFSRRCQIQWRDVPGTSSANLHMYARSLQNKEKAKGEEEGVVLLDHTHSSKSPPPPPLWLDLSPESSRNTKEDIVVLSARLSPALCEEVHTTSKRNSTSTEDPVPYHDFPASASTPQVQHASGVASRRSNSAEAGEARTIGSQTHNDSLEMATTTSAEVQDNRVTRTNNNQIIPPNSKLPCEEL